MKKRFSRCHHGGHLGFPISMILTIFDLQVTLMLPTKLRVNWLFGSGEEEAQKIDFQDGCHGGHLGFPIGTILAKTDLCHPDASYQVLSWHFGLGEEAKNRFSRWPPWRPSWIYDRHNFSHF